MGTIRTSRLFRVSPAILTASVGINLLALALPVVILQVYDRVIPNESLDTLTLLFFGMLVVLVLDALLRLARTYISGWHGMLYEYENGCRAVSSVLTADHNIVEREPAGVLLDHFAALDELRSFYSSQALLILVDLPFAMLFLGIMAAISGTLVLVPLCLIAAFTLLAVIFGRSLKEAIRDRSERDGRRHSFVIELLEGLHVIKAGAMEELMLRRYERLLAGTAAATRDVAYKSALSQGAGAMFSQFAVFGVVAIGSTFVIAGELTIGALAACTMMAGRSVQPLLRALGIWAQFQSISVARRRLDRIYALPPERAHACPDLPPGPGAIDVRNLVFRFQDDLPTLFNGLNLSVAAGETIAITGRNGSGKSTLLRLLHGGIGPSAGEILIDGNDVMQFDAHSVRRRSSYLPQNAVLFQGTVLENLTMFRDGREIDHALDLAAKLGVDRFMARLPQGYETEIGDSSGESLPGGVKQRIAIARALVGDAPIVLFDECNSSLDRESDDLLIELLKSMQGRHTIVLVSYRPSILRLASRIYEIHEGTLRPMPEERLPWAATAKPGGSGTSAPIRTPVVRRPRNLKMAEPAQARAEETEPSPVPEQPTAPSATPAADRRDARQLFRQLQEAWS